ncbi:MAG: glucose-6-phosphate dehydrogenase [Ignavibacteriae bacterium]|nr:MAG: glucose-6-phosphate dehydrogenase [Ignavibacteriota bacterium]
MEKNYIHSTETLGLESERHCDPCIVVIFGATGDLTRRKLMPALYNLYRNGFLAEGSIILGSSRTEYNDEQFREEMRKAIDEFGTDDEKNDPGWDDFAKVLFYISTDVRDSSAYGQLKQKIEEHERSGQSCGNRLFYFAMPPEFFDDIAINLSKVKLNNPANEDSWTRVIIEKPFGEDLESANHLNSLFLKLFSEKQIYRIDHYLGKETVQNLLAFRFGNSIFEPIWNRNYISNVQITAAETVGLENRADYYDRTGALRDMVQNHILQLLSLIAMEPPVNFEADIVRDEKVQVFRAIEPMSRNEIKENVIRGQYTEGVINGNNKASYANEKGVAPNSTTETYAAMKLLVRNWRWADVPFYIRTGKRLEKRLTDITLVFRRTPHLIFRKRGTDEHIANILSIRIQPDEGISFFINAKKPGAGMQLTPVEMDFNYSSTFHTRLSNAYERLLRDCLSGDQTLYSRKDAVEATWSIITPILNTWKEMGSENLYKYPSGSWGPEEANVLVKKDGKKWINY